MTDQELQEIKDRVYSPREMGLNEYELMQDAIVLIAEVERLQAAQAYRKAKSIPRHLWIDAVSEGKGKITFPQGEPRPTEGDAK